MQGWATSGGKVPLPGKKKKGPRGGKRRKTWEVDGWMMRKRRPAPFALSVITGIVANG